MPTNDMGADIVRSALLVVDMQNDFLHKDGNFPNIAREHPELGFDIPFLQSTIAPISRLVSAFRAAGRPVIYLVHVLKPDYSDAAFPYWRVGLDPKSWNRTHCVERTWGAEIVDDLKPRDDEPVIVKKGFGGFANTSLDITLRNLGVTTCVVAGVTTCVCVSNTVRGGVELNYRMILVKDGVAEVSRETHDAELETMGRLFADVRTTEEVKALLSAIST